MLRIADLLVRPLLVFAGVAVAALLLVRFLTLPGVDLARIAHAGGGLDDATYTNSIAALDANHARGYRSFEIDFLKTTDGTTVCGHDWQGFGGQALPIDLFNDQRRALKHRPCTLDEVVTWFSSHPDSLLVSDAKSHEAQIVSELAARLPSQLVAQAYDYRQVCALGQSGVERVVLTLYRLPRSYGALVSGLRSPCMASGRAEALTMDADRVWRGHALIAKLLTGLPVYAHTVNECNSARWLYLLGADQFYSDFLPASGC